MGALDVVTQLWTALGAQPAIVLAAWLVVRELREWRHHLPRLVASIERLSDTLARVDARAR